MTTLERRLCLAALSARPAGAAFGLDIQTDPVDNLRSDYRNEVEGAIFTNDLNEVGVALGVGAGHAITNADVAAIPTFQTALDGMTALTQVNGLNLGIFNNVAAGAVKNGGFTAIAIDPSTHTGTVTFRIKTATEVDAPDAAWTAVDATGTTTDGSSIRVPVPASGFTGFFKVVAE